MAATNSDAVNEVKTWLQVILKDEKLKDFSVNILGNTEKGDGYIGDVLFATVDGIKEDNTKENYSLVIKCSKRSQVLRDKVPVKTAFLNEILLYQTVFPFFMEFQEEHGFKDVFNSVPKCYGSYTGENMEIIVFENLKNRGYDLWPRKKPLTKKHIELVVTEYAKYHATSLAVQRERPEEFQKFIESINNVFRQFAESGDMKVLFGTPIDVSSELLKNDLDEKTLQKWQSLKESIDFITKEMLDDIDGVKAILHGDCWNNNFMFFHETGNEENPLKVAILDFQMSRYTTPIADLSNFLFCCASEEELQNLDNVLVTYHKSFVNNLRRMGLKDADTLYPLEIFFNDWRKYCKFGILIATLLTKIASTDKDEVTDISESVEDGKDFSAGFLHEIRDTENYKNRMRPIVKYAVENNVI